MTLGTREQLILKEVVNTYVRTAQPVGSRAVADRIELSLSPATIRNTMMGLEEKGLLDQPHASAGRIPTDLGYRAFVDGLMEPDVMEAVGESWVEEELAGSHGDMTRLLEQAARLLAGASHELGMVLAPSLERSILERLEFVRVSDQRILVLMKVRDGLVRNVFLDVHSRLDHKTLAWIESRLNESLVGLSLKDIRATLLDRAWSWDFRHEEVVVRFLAHSASLFGEPLAAIYVGGTTNMVLQPEFQSPDRLKDLLAMLEDRERLAGLLEERQGLSGVYITIGRENPKGPLSAMSVLTAAYSSGSFSGTVAILGPTRMPYRRAVNVLTQVVRHFDRRLSA